MLAIAHRQILPIYSQWKKLQDLSPARRNAPFAHFFEHYRDLRTRQSGSRVLGWEAQAAWRNRRRHCQLQQGQRLIFRKSPDPSANRSGCAVR